MDVTVSDVASLAQLATRVDMHPGRLAGRVAGLSAAEMNAGVPTWAWVTAAFVAGGVAVVLVGPRIREWTER